MKIKCEFDLGDLMGAFGVNMPIAHAVFTVLGIDLCDEQFLPWFQGVQSPEQENAVLELTSEEQVRMRKSLSLRLENASGRNGFRRTSDSPRRLASRKSKRVR